MNLLPEMAIMFAMTIGCIIHYIFEYLASKKLSSFNGMTWLKDNALKILIISPLCLIAYAKFVDVNITEQSAFLVGLGVSVITDRIQDMANKPKA